MHNSLISLGIPSYNRPEYLRLLIRSILAQTYENFEVVIFDDGSLCVADIEKVVREFTDKRIRLFLGENVWFIRNWNRILNLCQWEYIKILWDDDILCETCLEEQSVILQQNAKVWLVSCYYNTIDQKGVILTDKDFSADSFRIFKKDTKEKGVDLIKNYFLWKRRIGLPTAMMFRRSIISKIWEFNTEVWSPADIDYWIRICSQYDFYYIDKNLISMRWHANNLSKSLEKEIYSFEKMVYVIFGNALQVMRSSLSLMDRARMFLRFVYMGSRYSSIKNIYRISKIYVYLLSKLVFNY